MDGGEVDEVVRQPKRLAFLVYLALAEPRGFHRRDSLLPIIWPELPENRARNALNKTLHFLRSHLGDDVVESRGSAEVGLDPDKVWTDVAAFEDALADDSGFVAAPVALDASAADWPVVSGVRARRSSEILSGATTTSKEWFRPNPPLPLRHSRLLELNRRAARP